MNKNTKIVLGIAVIVLAALLIWNMDQKTAGGTVKIGFIGPLSGDAAAYGQESQRVVVHRLKEINAKGGVQFEIVYEDGKCSGSDAVTAFQKLTDVDGVKIILGGECSSETLGVAPLTKDGKALVVSALSSNPTIEGASPYVFSFSYSDQVIGDTLAEQMKGYSRVAIITEQNDYNVGIKNVWEQAIAKHSNVKVVANEVFPKGASDFRNLLNKVRQANPEAVLLNPNIGVTATNLVKQLAEMTSWKGYKVYTQIAYLADDTRAGLGNFPEGMVIVDAPDLTAADFLAYKDEIVQAEGPVSNIGNYYTAATIDSLDTVTTLVRELGNDAKKVRDALASRSFRGYLGDIRFDGYSFKRGSQGAVYVVTNGKATPR